jgi:hypothetical protein
MHDETVTTAGGRLTDKLNGLHPASGESASSASLSDRSPARRRDTGTQEA